MPFISICIISSPFVPTNHSNPFSFYLQLYHESNLMTSAKLLNCPTRTGRPGQSRAPRTTDLISLIIKMGSLEFDWRAAATAATPAAATQRSPAAGASGEVRSQVKNQAFPSFLYLQDTRLYPGLVCIYTCFLASQDGRQKFFPVFCGFYSEGCTGIYRARARCVNLWLRNKNGRNLSFFTGVSEFDCWARCASWAAGDPGLWVRELFREFSGVFKEFRGALIQLTRSGRPVRSWDLSTAYPQLSLY